MLSGSYVDAKRGPLRGSVQFTPISIGANGNDVVIDRPVYVRVNDGTFSVDLIPSTDPGWNTTGDVFYRVYEDIGGQKRSYVIAVPAGDSDIKDLQPIDDPQYVLAQPADALLPDPSAAPDDKWIKTTSGAYILTDAPSGTATPSDSTPSDVVDTATPGVSAALSRADHAHGGVTQSEFDAHGHTGTDDHAHAAYATTAQGSLADSALQAAHHDPGSTDHDDRYYTEGEIDTFLAGKEDTGVAASAVTTHEGAVDPHGQYVTNAEQTTALAGKSDTGHTHPATDISDSTVTGRAVVTAADAAAARTAIGAGTSSFDGNYASLSGLPTLGTAADNAETDFATAAQGATADSAVQDGDTLTTGLTQTTTHGNLPLMPVWTGTQTALDGITQVAGVIYLVTGP